MWKALGVAYRVAAVERTTSNKFKKWIAVVTFECNALQTQNVYHRIHNDFGIDCCEVILLLLFFIKNNYGAHICFQNKFLGIFSNK